MNSSREMLANSSNKMRITKLNFNHEFSEKFSVLDDKLFKNKKLADLTTTTPIVDTKTKPPSNSKKQQQQQTIKSMPISKSNNAKLNEQKLNKSTNKNETANSITSKRKSFSAAVLNTKAKLLNRVKKQNKKLINSDSKLSNNLLNELMTSLITYLNDSHKKAAKTTNTTRARKLHKTLLQSTAQNDLFTNNEAFYDHDTTNNNDSLLHELSQSPVSLEPTKTSSKSSSYSSLSRTSSSHTSSSSYFKMFSRPDYYKTLNENNKKKPKLLPSSSSSSSSSSSCSSLSASHQNMHSSLYLSGDDHHSKSNSFNHQTSSISSTTSSKHKQLEIPNNIEDPILFIDTLYNQLVANNNNTNSTNLASNKDDTDYRSSFNENLNTLASTRPQSITSSSTASLLLLNEPANYLLKTCDFNKRPFSNSITIDCLSSVAATTAANYSTRTSFKTNNLSLLMTSTSQSSPSLSFLSSSGVETSSKPRHNSHYSKSLYLSASMANLYSSSACSPSMSTSLNNNLTNQNSSGNTSGLHLSDSFKSSLSSPSIESSSPTKTTNTSSTANTSSSTNYMQIIFDSFLKSIKFLIMTKNVFILPLIIYLLNSKLNQFIATTLSTNESSSSAQSSSALFTTAASSIVTTASKSAKLRLNI